LSCYSCNFTTTELFKEDLQSNFVFVVSVKLVKI
jgi:hypothetical protein